MVIRFAKKLKTSEKNQGFLLSTETALDKKTGKTESRS